MRHDAITVVDVTVLADRPTQVGHHHQAMNRDLSPPSVVVNMDEQVAAMLIGDSGESRKVRLPGEVELPSPRPDPLKLLLPDRRTIKVDVNPALANER